MQNQHLARTFFLCRHAVGPRKSWLVFVAPLLAVALFSSTGLAQETAEAEVSFSEQADSTESSSSSRDAMDELKMPVVTTGWQASFSTGFGIGTGKFSATDKMQLSDNQRGMIPLWLDVGYRLTPGLFVGAYGQAGFLLLRQGGICKGEENQCSGQDYRAGLTVQYHFLPTKLLDPWVGVGAGYEWYYNTVSNATAGIGTMHLLFRGWEMVNLRVGLEIHENRQAAVGPFVAWTMGKFAKASLDGLQGDEPQKSLTLQQDTHQWIMFGLEGSFFDDI